MIEKFLQIKNVGKFVDYQAVGKVNLRKVTLIYGENGRGKTTLAAILRSLTLKEADHILARKTAGASTGKTNVQLQVRGINKPVVFRENITKQEGSESVVASEWDAHVPGIEIFDATFVNENVYSGSDVSHEHRKNLYYFVVGEDGVNLAQRIDDLDNRIKELKTKIAEKGAEIEKQIEWKGTVEKFIELAPVDDVDKHIKELKSKIDILEQADTISKRGLLIALSLNTLPVAELESLIEMKIEDLLTSAEQQVKAHIKQCMGDNGEIWLQEGVSYAKDDKCPFCGQAITGLELIQSYKGYFSQDYARLKSAIQAMDLVVRENFSEDVLLNMQKIFGENSALLDDWQSGGLNLDNTKIKSDNVIEKWKLSRDCWLELISAKNERPLDNIEKIAIQKASIVYTKLNEIIEAYNAWISTCNTKIKEFKQTVDSGNLETERKNLKILDATKKRYTKNIDTLCKEYLLLIGERKAAETDKKKAQKDLERFNDEVFAKYQNSINTYLSRFGVGFRLGKISTTFAGGKASTSYGLILNEVAVKLSSGAKAEPSFKSGASEGDKSSLAFAFFLAKLEHDKDINQKIVVIDDPITSLDIHRKNCTKDEILQVVKKSKQVIILSHDVDFLRMIWDNSPTNDVQTLQVQRKGKDGSVLSEWDIAEATRGDYYGDYFTLVNYAENNKGDSRLVVRAIRPLLEGYYRVRFPKEFPPNKWLGDFIDYVRNAPEDSPLHVVQKDLSEINAINNFSKKYHHKENPNADKETINDTELVLYIERTLKLISG